MAVLIHHGKSSHFGKNLYLGEIFIGQLDRLLSRRSKDW